jgi:dienelactone hydrolase
VRSVDLDLCDTVAQVAEVVVFHHVQGLTDGVRAFADELREDGHTVHTPDMFGGRTFATIDDGIAFAQGEGFGKLVAGGVAAADGLPAEVVYVGFSFGAMPAQQLAQTKPGARGALLIYGVVPFTEFGDAWPEGVPVQIHAMEDDAWFLEDLPSAQALADSTDAAALYLYPGDKHLFADASTADYDADAAALLMKRVRAFLAGV